MINLFKKNNKKYKVLHKPKLMNPGEHWVLLIRIFIGMGIGLIIFSLYLLFLVKKDDGFNSNINYSKKTPAFVEEDLLNKIKESIKKKNIKKGELEAGIISFTDPS